VFFSTIMSIFSCITRIYLYDKLHENEHLRQTSDTHSRFYEANTLYENQMAQN
jgi:hypothetical protein